LKLASKPSLLEIVPRKSYILSDTMLCLSRKTDYALIALGHLCERPTTVVSARDIASAYDLPAALLMNILKTLQKNDLLESVRGVNGGYRLAGNLESFSLYELIHILEGKVEPGCDHDDEPDGPHGQRRGSVQAPVQALHYKLMQFLHDVAVADLVWPGRRIDVPAESLRASKSESKHRKDRVAALV
jgi:Rrf2 family protein